MTNRQLQNTQTGTINTDRDKGFNHPPNTMDSVPQQDNERMENALIKALQEWEATFNATRDPIMLVTRNSESSRQIMRLHDSWAKPSDKSSANQYTVCCMTT